MRRVRWGRVGNILSMSDRLTNKRSQQGGTKDQKDVIVIIGQKPRVLLELHN